MALALDGSTPAVVHSVATSRTSASFTPPVGTVLVAKLTSNTISATEFATHAVTDSLGSTWTRRAYVSSVAGTSGAGELGSAEIWTRDQPGSGAAMTVTDTISGPAAARQGMLKVEVWAGANLVTPIGQVASAHGNTSVVSLTLTTLFANSWVLGCYGDWAAQAIPTAGTGCTVSDGNAAATYTSARLDRTGATSTPGAVVLSTSAPATAVWNLAAVELRAAPTAPNPNWPLTAFEVAFNADPADPAAVPVWTDLTGRGPVAWQHQAPSGRQYELARTEAAVISVQVDNQDGALDPSNTTSPYWPNVVPYRRWRIRCVYSNVAYNLAYGYVERWPQRWEDGKGWADLVIVDLYALLEGKTFRSCYDEEVLADGPVAYYPLSEPEGTTRFGSIATTQQPLAVVVNSKDGAGTVTPGQPAIIPSDPATCVQFAGGTSTTAGSVIQLAKAGVGPFGGVGGTSFTAECWFQIASAPGYVMTLVEQVEGNTGGVISVDWYLTINPDGKVHTPIGNVAHTDLVDAGSTHTFADGKPHHALVAWVVSGGVTTITLYVDGAVEATGFANVTFPQISSRGWLLIGGIITSLNHQAFYNGLISHVAIYPTGLSSGQALAHYQAGATAFAGELSGARYSRLLRYAAYQGPAAVDIGQSQMAAAEIAGLSATTALGDTTVAENGNQYAAGDGTATFKQRAARWNTTPVATLGELETPYLGDVRFDYDPTFLFTRIEETRPGGVTIAAFDQASQKRYGTRTLPETPQILLDLEATDRANYQLAQYKDPKLRLPQVTIDPASNPALWPVALGLKIGDRVTVKRRPFGAPVITIDCFVEAISHDADFGEDSAHWHVTYLLSPAGATFNFWQLDDANRGKLDSGNLVAY